MGIKTEVKNEIYNLYQKRCIESRPPKGVKVVSKCMMMDIKRPPPKNMDLDAYVRWVCRQAYNYFTKEVHTVIVNFDLGSPGVKQIVEHKKRYGGKKGVLKFEDGPHLNGKMPKDWMLFAADTRNLRRELYPLLYNCFLDWKPAFPGQRLILNGLPIVTRIINNFDYEDDCGYMAQDGITRLDLRKWFLDELPIKFVEEDYHKTFEIVGTMPSHKYPLGRIKRCERYDMQNDIHEADSSTFFFADFFPTENFMVVMNDGDGIMIGLLKVAKDLKIRVNRQMYLQLPMKMKVKPDPNNDPKINAALKKRYGKAPFPKNDYINLTKMYIEIRDSKIFLENGVQSPVASLVVLGIMAGCDFVKKCFPYVGWKNSVWQTYFDNLEKYSHMVQCYCLNREIDPKEERKVVIDEKLFVEFAHDCHRKQYKVEEIEQIKCSKRPNDVKINVDCRNIEWTARYWLNAPYNKYIDPLEKHDGGEVWGYTETKVVSEITCSRKPIDDTYTRNFRSNKKIKF